MIEEHEWVYLPMRGKVRSRMALVANKMHYQEGRRKKKSRYEWHWEFVELEGPWVDPLFHQLIDIALG